MQICDVLVVMASPESTRFLKENDEVSNFINVIVDHQLSFINVSAFSTDLAISF